MTGNVKGIVEYLDKKDSGFYSVKIAGEYFGAGKYAPKFDQGDEVSFDYTDRESGGKIFHNMTFGTVKVLEKGEGKPSASSSASATGSSKGTDWAAKDKRITFLACRKDALSLTAMALEHKAITLPTKAGEKLETLQSFIDTLTEDLYAAVYQVPYEAE